MTQDEPEREKTIEQHARNVMSAAVVPIRVRVLVDYLFSQITASEKRAEEAERQLGECSGGYETLEKELAVARSSLARVVEALAEIEKRTHNLSTFGALERAIDFIRTVARSALHRSGQ